MNSSDRKLPQLADKNIKNSKNMSVSAKKYAETESKQAALTRKDFSPETFIDSPLVNPAAVIELASVTPMGAARLCQNACFLLSQTHHKRMREYLVAAYAVASEMRGREDQIADLAADLKDGRLMEGRGTKAEKIEKNLLHYVFCTYFIRLAWPLEIEQHSTQ